MALLDAFNPILSLAKGLVSGLAGPVFDTITSVWNTKTDANLDAFKTAAGIDQAAYATHLDYELKIQQLKIASNGWWGAKFLYLIVGGSAAIHFSAVMLDSVPFWIPFHANHVIGSWAVPKLPTPYDTYEGWVVASLFVTSIAAAPVSAITHWFARK